MHLLPRLPARHTARAAQNPPAQAAPEEWPDPDQPGDPRPRTAVPAASHRNSLCTRTARWLCAGAGLLGLAWLTGFRGARDAVRSLPGTQPAMDSRIDHWVEPPVGPRVEAQVQPRARPSGPDEWDSRWGPPGTLPASLTHKLQALAQEEETGGTALMTGNMRATFEMDDQFQATKVLLALLLPPAGTPLSVAQVDRRVNAFRATPHWRKDDATVCFLTAMLELMKRTGIEEAPLAHLLRVWSWRYGEPQESPADASDTPLSRTLSVSIASMSAYLLGGSEIAETHLRILIEAVCRAPEGIPAGKGRDQVLDRHGVIVARALLDLVQALSQPKSGSSSATLTRLHEPQLRRCLRLMLAVPYRDGRWKRSILDGFDSLERIVQAQGWLPPGRLERLVHEALREEVAKPAPGRKAPG